jgi:hypothetical protein
MQRPSWETFIQWLEENGLSFTPTSKDEWLQLVQDKRAQVRGSALIDIWTSVSLQYPKQLELWSDLFCSSQIPDHGNADDAKVDMTQATTLLSSLAQAKAVDKELCKNMVKCWRSSGFLS